MNRTGSNKDRKEFMLWIDYNYSDIATADREALLAYGALILERSEGLGLVSRGDLPRLHMRHLREAAAPSFVRLPEQGSRVVDIGSGAGLPGIPLGILRRDVKVVLVEPRHRRAAFLERTVLQLGLQHVEVATASLDAFARSLPEAAFDLAVSRALAWTPAMVQLLNAILVPDGRVIRFGHPDHKHPGVQVRGIDSDSPRAIQVWPRSAWDGLPGAR